MKLRLSSAGPDYLEGALGNPQFGEDHLEAVLGNPALSAAQIQRIAAHKKWLTRYEVQRGIVLHRNAPRALQLNLLHFLRWRDLSRALESPHLPAPVRTAAEGHLKARLGKLTRGEKVALARVASPGVIPAFRPDLQPDIVAALLANPRLTEAEVTEMCAEERMAPESLAIVGTSERWSRRHPVRMALLRHPQTPPRVLMGFLDHLSAADLREILALPTLHRLVRATAKELLKSRNDSVDRRRTVF